MKQYKPNMLYLRWSCPYEPAPFVLFVFGYLPNPPPRRPARRGDLSAMREMGGAYMRRKILVPSLQKGHSVVGFHVRCADGVPKRFYVRCGRISVHLMPARNRCTFSSVKSLPFLFNKFFSTKAWSLSSINPWPFSSAQILLLLFH